MTIISFKHRFIFIKTRKVGGTSVEAALRAITGENDIVTPATARDEYHCASSGFYSQNYCSDPAEEARYTELVLARQLEEAQRFSDGMRKRYTSHMRAREIRRKLGRRDFAGFFKFTIERNPYSWLVSIAAYDKKAYQTGTLSAVDLETIRSRIKARLGRRSRKWTNHAYYTIGSTLAVDRVIRYENLEQELGEVMGHLGISQTLSIPRLKANPQDSSTSEIFTQELEAVVQDRFSPVFDLMDYPRALH